MPSRQVMRYVIAYDVVKDSSRTKLANILLDYGIRVQKSVFEADLTREDVKEILQKVSKYIEAEDSLCLYPLCKSCSSAVQAVGTRMELSVSSLRIV